MSRTRNKKADVPSPEDFSNRAVNKAVLSEALQHPTTLFPAAVSILSALYMTLVNFNETSFALAVGSGFLSLVSWIFHYFVRGETIAENYIKELKEKRKVYKKQQVEDIEERCKAAGFTQGQQAAKELLEAYTRLYQFLKEKSKKVKSMTAQRFMILAEETYDQGVKFLNKALVLYQALNQIDEKKLIKELRAWQKEVKNLEKNGQKEEEQKDLVIQALQEKVRSHCKRLELFSERGETLKQMLDQCEILEATLDSTYLEVVDLMDSEAHMNVKHDNAASNLERAVAAARKVEDRLRSMGRQEEIDDSIYTQPSTHGGVEQ
ncbi:MAG: N-acetyltransferase [Candidatus Aminicenantes bacterium]|nr:MAG: N-acetyltransferase [Candidatus Aminicenantes bacterium]